MVRFWICFEGEADRFANGSDVRCVQKRSQANRQNLWLPGKCSAYLHTFDYLASQSLPMLGGFSIYKSRCQTEHISN